MCNVCGITGVSNAAVLVKRGLHGGQNRASDYAGIATTDGTYVYRHAAKGLARNIFTSSQLGYLRGSSALGHLRYPTVDDKKELDNAQPIGGNWRGLQFFVSHNGNLTNTLQLERRFHHRTTTMDTEYIVRLIENSKADNIEEAIRESVKKLRGSFALGILLQDHRLIAVQDPQRNHPLSIGKVGEGFALSSETTGLTAMGAEWKQDVEPGTMVVIDNRQIKVLRFAEPQERRCAFEHVYLSMPPSRTFGASVSEYRRRAGIALEQHCPVRGGADIVVGVPDSAILYAMGYGESGRSGVYCHSAILRHHEAGRNFLLDTQENREDDIELKHLFDAQAIQGQRIVLVDDSLVRGTTSRWLMDKLRKLKAKEVHVRIACPPIRHPCLYGVNTRTSDELIANKMNPEDLRVYLQADSLAFLPLEVFHNILPTRPGEVSGEGHCTACWTGKYWHLTT